ncbi:MAG: cbb3-type cytochrome oxidase assembly protein CcoS [Gammaproteobacteria bacterium]|nr:cbb3-type cytochrome oxidase assembly protein CcoS [Gammaproteobacteria bacterium]MDH5512045.1 cbb3-type cytochrome oxidase assembly protein CcoS [Gammaproteobacteria bacterium]
MEILYLLVPLAVIIAGVIVWAFLWSIRSGQFDDLEGPAHRILMDEEDSPRPRAGPAPDTEKPPRGGHVKTVPAPRKR